MMDNKYTVISKEEINDKVDLYTLVDLSSHGDYSCIIDRSSKKPSVLMDDLANKFDVGEALFQYDLDILPILPIDMVSFNMEREYNDYYPGKGKSLYKIYEDYQKDYDKEEERVNILKQNVKKLVKK